MIRFLFNIFFMVTLFILSACTTKEAALSARFAGKEVYICSENLNNVSPGKKTIEKITHIDANNYSINMINVSKGRERTEWTSNKSDCIEEIEEDLISDPYCSLEEFNQYQQRKAMEAHKEKERRALEKAKIEKQRSDCQEAIAKAKKRHNEINSLDRKLIILDETITSNPKERVSNWSFCLKVVDYSSEGVIVKSDCTFSPLANLILKTLIGCEEKNYFIYTADKYADGECYKDWEYLHEDMGVYVWRWNNTKIRSYKKANYKISEIEYKTYLNDKTIDKCE